MSDWRQCSAFVRSRESRVESRPCKYPVMMIKTETFAVRHPDGFCRFHARRGAKPRPVRCMAEVLTYSNRGTHQCRLRATQDLDGEQFCLQHAKALGWTAIPSGMWISGGGAL